jgi:hypothetical protein
MLAIILVIVFIIIIYFYVKALYMGESSVTSSVTGTVGSSTTSGSAFAPLTSASASSASVTGSGSTFAPLPPAVNGSAADPKRVLYRSYAYYIPPNAPLPLMPSPNIKTALTSPNMARYIFRNSTGMWTNVIPADCSGTLMPGYCVLPDFNSASNLCDALETDCTDIWAKKDWITYSDNIYYQLAANGGYDIAPDRYMAPDSWTFSKIR